MVVADADIAVTCAALAAVHTPRLDAVHLAAAQSGQKGSDPLANLIDRKKVRFTLGGDRMVPDECVQPFKTCAIAERLIHMIGQGVVGAVFRAASWLFWIVVG